jgi:ArsR family transcriptional regulator
MELDTIDKFAIIRPEDLKMYRSQFEESAYILKALANETRLCVIMQLSRNNEMTVSELRESADCEQSLLSHHLTDMRAKGILHCRRDGRNNYYSLKDKRITNVLKCLMNCDFVIKGENK